MNRDARPREATLVHYLSVPAERIRQSFDAENALVTSRSSRDLATVNWFQEAIRGHGRAQMGVGGKYFSGIG